MGGIYAVNARNAVVVTSDSKKPVVNTCDYLESFFYIEFPDRKYHKIASCTSNVQQSVNSSSFCSIES